MCVCVTVVCVCECVSGVCVCVCVSESVVCVCQWCVCVCVSVCVRAVGRVKLHHSVISSHRQNSQSSALCCSN